VNLPKNLKSLDELIGEVWHGEAKELIALLPDNSIDAVIMNPPAEKAWLEIFAALRRVVKDTGVVWYITTDDYTRDTVIPVGHRRLEMIMGLGWKFQGEIVYSKNRSEKDEHRRLQHTHDHVFHLVKSEKYRFWRIPELDHSVWNIQTDDPIAQGLKYWQSPAVLLMGLLKTSCPDNGLVLDPFLGSGETAIACERLGNRWIGCDIDEGTVNKAKSRITSAAARGPLQGGQAAAVHTVH